MRGFPPSNSVAELLHPIIRTRGLRAIGTVLSLVVFFRAKQGNAFISLHASRPIRSDECGCGEHAHIESNACRDDVHAIASLPARDEAGASREPRSSFVTSAHNHSHTLFVTRLSNARVCNSSCQ